MNTSSTLSHAPTCDHKFPTCCPLCQDRLEAQDQAMRYHYANAELALALGWTNIVELGGSLLGQPADGAPSCRGQAKVPDWCGDWSAAGELLERYQLTVCRDTWFVTATARCSPMRYPSPAAFNSHRDIATAIRYAIVRATTKMLGDVAYRKANQNHDA